MIYLDRGVCGRHWNHYMREDAPPDALRKVLGIEAERTTAMEEEMTAKKTTDTKAEKPAGAATATPVKPTKPRKTAAKTKAAEKPKPKAAKPTKHKKEKGPKPNRVFAIRVTDEELAAIHKAAGPRNATRFIRAVAAAFAAEDEAAFRAVVQEARRAR